MHCPARYPRNSFQRTVLAGFVLLGIGYVLLASQGTASGAGGVKRVLAPSVDPNQSSIPGVIVGSPSGLARPYTVTLRQADGTLVSGTEIPEVWLGYDVPDLESKCDLHASPTPYKPATGGDILECRDPDNGTESIDWPYNESSANPATFHPRFGGRGDMSLDVQAGLAASPFYVSVKCVVARSTDFNADGMTDQADKLEIGHAIASGSPAAWYNLDTDDPNDTVINASDYMVVVAEMQRNASAFCSCPSDPNAFYPVCNTNPPVREVDDSPPQPTTLSVASDNENSITLHWQSPGDDYDLGQEIGVPNEYDLRYSNAVITSGNFGSAPRYTGTPTPGLAGTTETVTINSSCVPARYWAIKTKDNAGWWSSMSNVLDLATVTPISTVTPCASYKDCVLVGWVDPAATAYDLRYSTSSIDESNFCSAWSGGTPSVSGGVAEKRLTGLYAGTTYYFAVRWKNSSGRWSGISNVASTTTPTTGSTCATNIHCADDFIQGYPSPVAEDRLDLAVPSPNPAATSTTIGYTIPSSLSGQRLNLSVYDIVGRRLSTLVDEVGQSGQFSQTWNLRDERGGQVRSGVYFVRLTLGDERLLRRIIVSSR